ncbi:hypothetical protein [Candidatus Mycoplasma haematohominis]|uniref:Uncharacterized protein n=1 Tax=Candidatus Mycoplasma haematohominis TaxID=1494318 RepID=A0A478FQH2_9MOLU|nr:hypothetical protein [Candidatus Mycoplasma haemohominis]GCE63703.1 hypothetical protein MHSWG343_07030 [Candidatus Mycoplasma haemohominis]
MSTQALGAAAAGTAIVGGGGTLAAYAAGAFGSSSELYYWMKSKNLLDKYIGGDLTRIEEKIKNGGNSTNSGYKKNLNDNWDEMKKEDFPEGSRPERPDKNKIANAGQTSDTDSNDLKDIANFVNKWCELRLGKGTVKFKENTNPKEYDEGKLTDPKDDVDKKWKAFREVCVADS